MGQNEKLRGTMSGKNLEKPLGRKLFSYWPELLVLLLCAVLLLSDISHKKGYHMDELLSFELANAEFNPWIVPTQPQGRLAKFVEQELRGENFGETCANLVDTVKDILQNRGGSKLLSYQADVYPEPVWIDRQQFIDYITVDEKDAFQYLSVYFNVKDDNHPPLHFMLLHTVSSVFKGQLTPLMGCGINLVCVLGIMVLLMRLGRQLMRLEGQLMGPEEQGMGPEGQPTQLAEPESCGRWAGLLAAGLYGLSAGALSTTLLIRMYAMVTFFCVALLAVHVRKLYHETLGGSGFAAGNKLLILVTVLGFWTQYFFLFYCLFLAAVTAVLLWREGRKKELWHYVRAMVTAAVIGVAVFPFSIADVFSSGRGVEALENLSSGLAGYGERLAAFAEILIKRLGVGCVAVLCAALVCCALRGVYGVFVRKSRNRGNGKGAVKCGGIVCLLVLPVLGYFLLAARMSPYLVDRYIMPVFPFVILLLVTALVKSLTGVWSGRSASDEAESLSASEGAERFRASEKKRSAKRKPDRGTDRGLWIAPALVSAAAVACQLWNPLRYEDTYLYEAYEAQEELAEKYAAYPCICIVEGVGYYENLLEFTCYERTLILSPQEFENRAERDSIASLERVVLLLKDGLDRDKICRIFEETYGLYPEEVLMDAGGVYGDQILLLEQRK